jgi:methyl-accepting chemotaxis protein
MTVETDLLLTRLKSVCERLAQGEYDDLDDLFSITGAEEAPQVVRDLAEAFASMAVQIEGREFRLTETLAELNEAHRQLGEANKRISHENEELRDEVHKLRIEIDVGKRDREVSEIVESDYFQSLRARAAEMRGRFRGATPPSDDAAG